MSAAAGQGRAAAAATAPATRHPATAGPPRADTRPSAAAEALRAAQSATTAATSAGAQRLPAFADADLSASVSSVTASLTTTAASAPAGSNATHDARGLRAAAAPLQLRIDRLVIEGLPRLAGGERALRAALLQELQQLLAAQPPALTQGGAIARLPALELALPADGDAASVGRALARALHRSLGA